MSTGDDTSSESVLECPHCGANTARAAICQACGDTLVIAGQFELESLRGHGSGKVYRARRDADGLLVAVKVLSLQNTDWKSAEQFERGASVMKGLEHPSLPRVYDFAQDDRGKLFLVRELLADDTLEERVQKGRHIDAASFRGLLFALLRTARYLHGLVPPLVHRDVKPSNIMFRSESSWAPVLVDFDHVAAPDSPEDAMVLHGVSNYAAPEQLEGAAVLASDLYSIGMTMAFVATRQDPESWGGIDGRDRLADALTGLNPQVRDVVLKLSAPELEQRFVTAEDALAALEPVEEPPEELPHIGADEMTSAELELRIKGWLQARNKNPRLLVPYLARLDQLGYEMYREQVAHLGGIRLDQLDRGVRDERARLQRRKELRENVPRPFPQRTSTIQQYRGRRTPSGRVPNKGSGCATIFALLMVAATGLVSWLVVDIGTPAQVGEPPPCIETRWLSLQTYDEQQCIYWAGRRVVRLGCSDEPSAIREACQAMGAVQNGAPDQLTDNAAFAIAQAARDARLVPLITPGEIMSASPQGSPASSVSTPGSSGRGNGSDAGGGGQSDSGLTGDDGSSDDGSSDDGASSVGAPTETTLEGDQPAGEVEMLEIELISEPPGALVKVRDHICTTPCTVNTPRGEKFVARFELKGYRPLKQKVRAYSNKTVSVELDER